MPIIQKSAEIRECKEMWYWHSELTMDSDKIEVGMLGGKRRPQRLQQ
jgi:hypothetical protein